MILLALFSLLAVGLAVYGMVKEESKVGHMVRTSEGFEVYA